MSILRRIARPVRGPVRRVVGPTPRSFETLIHAVKNELTDRLDTVDEQMEELAGSVTSSHTSLADQLALQAASQRSLEHLVRTFEANAAEILAEMKEAAGKKPIPPVADQIGVRLSEIKGETSQFLNYAQAHNGPLADAGLWINHPVVMEWGDGTARPGVVNERIIEQPFVYGAVTDLPPGARILDIGGSESTIGFALASLGYDVTVIDPQGYPFTHPNLTLVTVPLEQFAWTEPFDAAILLSAIEHFGIGHYQGGGEPDLDADVRALGLVADLLAPGGRLVLTTPYGPAEVNELERIYDRPGLEKLLVGWQIVSCAIGHRLDRQTWTLESVELIDPPGPGRVVMVVATLAGSA